MLCYTSFESPFLALCFLLMNVQCRGCSRSFTKEKRALKMMSVVASHWKLTINWEQSSKLILLQQHERLPKNSALTILWSFDIWSKLERWKSLVSRCLLSWPQIKKIILKCCLLLFYATTVNHFLIGLWQVMKSGFHMTTTDDQLSVWTKKKLQALPKAKFAPKMGWVCVYVMLTGGVLLVWSTTAFWILAKLLHLRSMLSKSIRCTKICSACNWHWSTERAQFFCRTTPDCRLHN